MSWYVMVSHHYLIYDFLISVFFPGFCAGRRWWWRWWWWRTAHSPANSWSSGCVETEKTPPDSQIASGLVDCWIVGLLHLDFWEKNTLLQELLWIWALIRWQLACFGFCGPWGDWNASSDWEALCKLAGWLWVISKQPMGRREKALFFFSAGRTCVPAQSGGLQQKVANNTAVHVSCFLHPLFNLCVGWNHTPSFWTKWNSGWTSRWQEKSWVTGELMGAILAGT